MPAKITTFGPNQAVVRELERWYTLHESQDVIDFLEDYPHFSRLLEEARIELRRYFPAAPLDLRIVPNDGNEDDQQLVLAIGTHLAPQAALENLRLLDRSWWLSAVPRADGRLLLTVTFL
jgi:hypothetical protein